MHCPSCGKENPDSAEVCFSCGAALPKEGPESLLGRVVFGQYELLEMVGEGGMAVVYRARHQLTGQLVAVKMLPPELAVYPEVRARFVDEARTLARLEHPSIVHLINFSEELGRLCLMMQYAEGETLEDMLDKSGRVVGPEAVRITLQVLSALDHSHAQGVVHRDIKPSNIIVRPDGTVKVTDFGIAKITRDTKLTQTGQTMGTVRYMSPEQVRGEAVDGRSDIYSLGVTLYEAVVGHTPFDGETHFAIMSQHLSEEAKSPLDAGARISQELADVILKALEKDPEDRFASAKEMAKALEHTPEGKRTRQHSTRNLPAARSGSKAGKRRIFMIATGAGLALSVGIGIGWWVLGKGTKTSRSDSGSYQQPKESGPAKTSDSSVVDKELTRWKTQKDATLSKLDGLVQWKVQAERNEPPYLKVWSEIKLSSDDVESLYREAIPAYQALLKAERVDEPVTVRPLDIVILSHKTFADKKIWGKLADAASRYFPLPVATLYVPADDKGLDRSALLYGIASHLCPPRLSASQCDSLGTRFEKFFTQRTAR